MKKLKMLKPRLATLNTNRVKVLNPDSWRSTKTTTERGYGYRWQKAREQFLRAHPLCCYCQRKGLIEPASIVDHITPHRGDMALFWDESNWQPLCKPCHDSTKKAEEAKGWGLLKVENPRSL